MEERAIDTLKSMLSSRAIKVENVESLGNPIDETRMYSIGGVLVIFSEKSRMTDTLLQTYITFADENNYKHGTIIVALVPPSENVLDAVRSHNNVPANPLLQIFDIRRLQFDITTHRKVPRHRILEKEEISKLEKKMNVVDPKRQFPWIDSQDAMAKWIGARPGDVVEIVRFSESAGDSKYYRYCTGNVKET
jgi:DNA-directed RNA polymerase subunit H (RpoH/RPB5)